MHKSRRKQKPNALVRPMPFLDRHRKHPPSDWG